MAYQPRRAALPPAENPVTARRALLDQTGAPAPREGGPARAETASTPAPAAPAAPIEQPSGGAQKPSLARTAASGARVTMLGQLVRFVVQIGGLMVMSRLLGPAEVGLVAMVTAIVNIADIVRDFGLSSAAIQSKELTEGERTNLFWANVGIGTICALVVALGSGAMASFYGEPRVQAIALTLAGLFVLSGANTQMRADLTRSMRFGALARSDVVSQLAAVVLAILAASQGASYWAVVLQQATVVTVSLLMNWVQCRWMPGLPKRDVSIRRFLEYGRRVLGTNLLGYALNNVDTVGLSAYSGKEVVGLYSRSFNLLQMPLTQLSAPLGRVALPVLSRVQEDRSELQRYFTPFQRAICYVLGLAFGMMAALASPLVHIMLGAEWSAAGPILAVLSIGGVFKVMDSANYQIWLATAKTKELMRFYLWSRPVMMVMILAGLPWGALGVATSGTVVAIAHWMVSTLYLCSVTDLRPLPLYRTAATAVAGGVLPASLVAWWVQGMVDAPFVQLFAGGFAGLATLALVAALVPAVRRDLVEVMRVVTMRKKG